MKKLLICMVLLVVALVVAGCVPGTDPNTGAKTWRFDPNAAATAEKYVETGTSIMTVLAPIFPVLYPVLLITGGVLAGWRKMKPKVTKAQNRAELCHTAIESLVVAIEELKEVSPESWEKLKEKIKVGPEIENIIRAIRLLPPKT